MVPLAPPAAWITDDLALLVVHSHAVGVGFEKQ
jgi:hypothetical protein